MHFVHFVHIKEQLDRVGILDMFRSKIYFAELVFTDLAQRY